MRIIEVESPSFRRLARGLAGMALAALLTLPLLAPPLAGQAAEKEAPQKPPVAQRGDVVDTYHGVQVADPYRWLEDQQSPETRAWIDAENAYTDSLLGALPGREALEKRITALMKVDSIGVPTVRHDRFFFLKRNADQDLSVLYLRQGVEGKDEVLLDPHPLSPDHTTSVSLLDVSEDGTLLAYGLRQGGADELSIHLMNVDTRKPLADELPNARYFSVSLTPDGQGFYYTRHTDAGPRVYYHKLGTDPAGDPMIFGEGYGPEKIIFQTLSEDGRYLVIHVLYGSAADQTEVYVQDLKTHGPIEAVVKDIKGRFFGGVGGDTLFLQTDWKAPKGRVLAVDLAHPEPENWKDVIPESSDVIDNVSLASGRIFVTYLEDVRSVVKVFSPAGKLLRTVDLPAIGSVGGMSGEWSSPEVYFAFSSFPIPTTIYRYNAETGAQAVWAKLQVPVDTGQFEVKQVWYESKDKTRVPMFLVYRRGLKLDGSNPVFLTGYGGFDLSMTPSFSATAVVWVEHGGVFALPNLRGGGEFGEAWHKAGMRENKQNVFDDFIAAAEWLIANRYTRPEKLAIAGGSNGGLLVGAALTQRPDLYRAVVCAYPLLDMLRYQNFLVAKFWVPEYGSSENADEFKYIYAYSPYQHVKRGTDYPAVLFLSGDADTRVAPLHARKMAAELQWATGSDRPILLHYDTKSGHVGSAAPVSKRISDLTDELGFLFWQLGVQTSEPEKKPVPPRESSMILYGGAFSN